MTPTQTSDLVTAIGVIGRRWVVIAYDLSEYPCPAPLITLTGVCWTRKRALAKADKMAPVALTRAKEYL